MDVEAEIVRIERDRRRREDELYLLLMLLAFQVRRYAIHAVRLGADPIGAMQKVWMGDSSAGFHGAINPLTNAMVDAHKSGFARGAQLAQGGGKIQGRSSISEAESSSIYKLYEATARRSAQQSLDTLIHRLVQAYIDSIGTAEEIKAFKQGMIDGGWIVDPKGATGTASAIQLLATQSILQAYGIGQAFAYRASLVVRGFRHESIIDSRTTDICYERHNLQLPISDPYWSYNWPPLHFHCRSIIFPVTSDGPWTDPEDKPTIPLMTGFGILPPFPGGPLAA